MPPRPLCYIGRREDRALPKLIAELVVPPPVVLHVEHDRRMAAMLAGPHPLMLVMAPAPAAAITGRRIAVVALDAERDADAGGRCRSGQAGDGAGRHCKSGQGRDSAITDHDGFTSNCWG